MVETNGRNFDLLTLGQVLLRLSPPDNERLSRGDTYIMGRKLGYNACVKSQKGRSHCHV